MRARIPAFLSVVVLLLTYSVAPMQAAQQHAVPIKKTGLIKALGIDGLSPEELIKLIDQRGVNFRMGFDDEEEIRNAGASDAIVDAIRKHYHSTPTTPADKTNAANLLKSSRALLDAHDPNSALPVVVQALAMDQDDADAFVLRGRIYLATSQPKKAQADFSIALQIKPGHAEAKQLMATAANPGNGEVAPASTGMNIAPAGHSGFLGFRWRVRNGQLFVAGVLPLGSGARGGIQVGDVLLSANGMSMKDFADQYVTPSKLTPGMNVRFQIQRQGQPLELQMVAMPRPAAGDEALNYFGQVIQLFPGRPEGYLYRAIVYGQVKNYNAALEDWNNFIRLAPDDPVGYGERAKIKTALGDQAGAKADQDEVARLTTPNNNTAPPSQPAAAPERTRGGNTAPNPGGNPAAMAPFPQRWSLLQYNKLFTMRMVGNHLYMQSTDNVIVADAEQTTDKKGAVVFKGKWRQKNANGTFSTWNMTLKTVSPERVDGTVLTLVFTGEPVTFIPQ